MLSDWQPFLAHLSLMEEKQPPQMDTHHSLQELIAPPSTKHGHRGLLLLLLLSRFSRVQLCATPETAAHQAPPSMGFSRQEYWSGVPLALTRQTFVGKVMSLLFNMLSRLAPLTPIQFNKHV